MAEQTSPAPQDGSSKKKPRKKASRKKAVRKRKAGSAGLTATEVPLTGDDDTIDRAQRAVEGVGGHVLAPYRDPLGGKPQLLASLPVDQVRPSAFQRDLSDTHVKKLMGVLDRLGHYLDPIVVVVGSDGSLRTPNGHHRLEALRRLGGRSIVALVCPEPELEYQILALNTEKSPGLKDRCAETIRLARTLSEDFDPAESEFELQFEEAAHLTLGLAYEERPRLSGSTYHPIVRRCDAFMDVPLSESLPVRQQRAERVLALDDRVKELVDALTERGFDSPYLKAFVVARLNPMRRNDALEFDEAFDRMQNKAEKFDIDRLDPAAVGRSRGPSGDD